MNANILQEKIIANPENIIQILEALGFDRIKDKGKYYQFPNKDGDNLTACSILKSTLTYTNFTRGEHGNLFTLCMSEKSLSFPQVLKWISHEIGVASDELDVKVRKPFGGFYDELKKEAETPEELMRVYSIDILKPYLQKYNMMFYSDGVSLESQEVFNLGYYLEENVILIPIYDLSGRLVGCKARRNDKECELSERWFAFLPFAKTYVVYGYHINYEMIIKKDACIIFEAEKSVMQCHTMDCHIALSVLGHDISDVQAIHIKALKTKIIIVAFDEGLSEEEIKFQASKLITNNTLCKNKVGYIYDRSHKFLKQDSKDSPSDHGRDVLYSLLEHCVVWIK